MVGCVSMGDNKFQFICIEVNVFDVGVVICVVDCDVGWFVVDWWCVYCDLQFDVWIVVVQVGNLIFVVVEVCVCEVQVMVCVVCLVELLQINGNLLLMCQYWLDNVYYGLGLFVNVDIWNNIGLFGLLYYFDLWGKDKNVIEWVFDIVYVIVVDVWVVKFEFEVNVVCVYVGMLMNYVLLDFVYEMFECQCLFVDFVCKWLQVGFGMQFDVSQVELMLFDYECQIDSYEEVIQFVCYQFVVLVGKGLGVGDVIKWLQFVFDVLVGLLLVMLVDLFGCCFDVVVVCWMVDVQVCGIDVVKVLFYLNIDLFVMVGGFGVIVLFIDFLCVMNGGWMVGFVLLLLIFEGGWLCVQLGVVNVGYDQVVECYNQMIVGVFKDIVDQVVWICLFDMQKKDVVCLVVVNNCSY